MSTSLNLGWIANFPSLQASTRCVIKRDSGATRGELEGQTLFCIDFARG